MSDLDVFAKQCAPRRVVHRWSAITPDNSTRYELLDNGDVRGELVEHGARCVTHYTLPMTLVSLAFVAYVEGA